MGNREVYKYMPWGFRKCNGICTHETVPKILEPPTETRFNDLVAFLISPCPDFNAQCPLRIEVILENNGGGTPTLE